MSYLRACLMKIFIKFLSSRLPRPHRTCFHLIVNKNENKNPNILPINRFKKHYFNSTLFLIRPQNKLGQKSALKSIYFVSVGMCEHYPLVTNVTFRMKAIIFLSRKKFLFESQKPHTVNCFTATNHSQIEMCQVLTRTRDFGSVEAQTR